MHTIFRTNSRRLVIRPRSSRAAALDRGPAGPMGVVGALLLLALVGCTPRPPVGDDPVVDRGPEVERAWTCRTLDTSGAEDLTGLTATWTARGGSMLSAHRTSSGTVDSPGLATRDDAVADAAKSAAAAALDLLKQRGITYEPERRRSIVNDVVSAVVRGDDVTFPRMTVLVRGWEECVAVADGATAGSDTLWRAALLAEYPIGLLRGDVKNVLWERVRAANEAEVLVASAEEHLAAGHWHAGLLSAVSVADVVTGAGAPLSDAEVAAIPGARGEAHAIDARLASALSWCRSLGAVVTSLRATAVGGVVVVGTGEAVDEAIQFQCSYEWGGSVIPAAGLPVRFEAPGASAVLRVDPTTDESGVATCRVLAAYGPPGEYELTLDVDTEAADAVLSGLMFSGEARSLDGVAPDYVQTPLASRVVHLVGGAHAVSVCATFGERGDSDAAQAMAGFTRRMERDGFSMDDCGPGVDVVVTGDLSLAVNDGVEPAIVEVTLSASVFDQRTASELGTTRVRATQTVDNENPGDGLRQAEVLALKEAGRLLAVYFGPRVLAPFH